MSLLLSFRRKRTQVLIFSLFAGVLLFSGMLWFAGYSRKALTENFINSINEVNRQQLFSFKRIFDLQFNTLELCARVITGLNSSDYLNTTADSEISEDLDLFTEKSPFEVMFINRNNGIAIASDGDVYDNNGYDFYENAIQGDNCVSQPLKSPISDDTVIVCTIPLYDKLGQIFAVLGGVININYLNSAMMVSYDGHGYSLVTSKTSNTIIAHTANTWPSEFENASFINLYASNNVIKRFNGNCIIYRLHDLLRYVVYVPTGYNDWVLATIVPESVLKSRLKQIRKGTAFTFLMNLFAFVCIITFLVFLQAKHSNEFARASNLDTVTNGITLKRFMEKLNPLFKNNRGKSFIAMCMDINEFRVINELYGFQAGNRLLYIVHKAVKNVIGIDGLVCRSANDLFYIIIKSDTDKNTIIAEKDSIIEEINRLLSKESTQYVLNFTFGIYPMQKVTEEPVHIFEKTNQVHNRAKKNNIPCEFYLQSEHEQVIRQKLIENSMQEAFENCEFKMFLQPKFELLSKRLVGAEALVRWESPTEGKRYPCDFIPLFEKNGFIIKIDLYMIEKACQTIRRWIDSGIEPIPISVNQSKVLLLNPLYYDVLINTVENYRIPPKYIELEITETIMYENTKVLNELIGKLKNYGFRIAVDDFGSGYSSLVLLRDIKADVLKIDKAFITRAEDDVSGKKILSGIIQLADSLNMIILAEGIETNEQADLLIRLGCREAQGFLFGKPVPEESFVRFQQAV